MRRVFLNRTSKSKEDDTGDIIDALSSKLDSLQLEQNLESKPVFAGYRSSSFTQASWLHLAFLNFEERPHGPREDLEGNAGKLSRRAWRRGRSSSHMSRDGFYGIGQSATFEPGQENFIR